MVSEQSYDSYPKSRMGMFRQVSTKRLFLSPKRVTPTMSGSTGSKRASFVRDAVKPVQALKLSRTAPHDERLDQFGA